MKRVWYTAGKAIAGGLGCVALASTSGALHGNVLILANAAIAVATVLGIYHAPYTPTTPAK